MQGREEAAGSQEHRALGEDSALVIHPLQIALGNVSHADGPSRAVQELVSISRRASQSQKSLKAALDCWCFCLKQFGEKHTTLKQWRKGK